MDKSEYYNHARWYLVLALFTLLAFSPQCARSQGPLSTNMYRHAMSLMPECMDTATNMLKDTLLSESDFANKLRRFGRRAAHTRSFKSVQGFLGSTPYGKHLSYPSFVQLKTMAIVRARMGMSNLQLSEMMGHMPAMLSPSPFTIGADGLPPRPDPLQCPYARAVMCQPDAQYRTYDGRCNNLREPLWGSSHQPLSRFLPSQYADGLEAARVSVTGVPLPSARLVSSTVHWDFDIPHPIHTLMVMQLGQFVDHDMSRTAITKLAKHPSGFTEDLADVECGDDGCDTEGLENQACLPIPVPFNDTDFGGQRCLMFVRSQDVPQLNCKVGPRQQLNQLTSFLDASHVYGSTKKEAFELRDLSDSRRGKLLMKTHPAGRNYRPMLPSDPGFEECRGDNFTAPCFRAGDGRVNEFIGITTLHTIMAREHNRIEGILHQINPHWTGEILYQETRRIIIAMWQHIIYAEYLPLIVGPAVMARYELGVSERSGYWNGYNENTDPSIANSFATAAMRFGHSQIQGMLKMMDPGYNQMAEMPISFLFRDPSLLYNPPLTGCDAVLRGLMSQPSQSMDSFITKQVTKHLFADRPPHGKGEDLAALNIQRGREHGLPGYNYYREWCGLSRAFRFEDLSKELPRGVIERFKRLYKHVDDIDLFPASIAEFSYPGSLLGPTFSCIIGSQFRNLKHGDRYWYENRQHNPRPFSLAQLADIKQITLAGLFCNNGDSIGKVQPHVLLQPRSHLNKNAGRGRTHQFDHLYSSGPNNRVPCNAIRQMSFESWREAPPTPFAPHQFSFGQPHPNALPGAPKPTQHSVMVVRKGLTVQVTSQGNPVRLSIGGTISGVGRVNEAVNSGKSRRKVAGRKKFVNNRARHQRKFINVMSGLFGTSGSVFNDFF